MNPTVLIALLSWIPLSAYFFLRYPRRKAALITLLGGWLILPIAGFRLHGIPDFDKSTAIAIGLALGWVVSRPTSEERWRLSLLDLPVLLRCLSPLASSLANGLGAYDGLSACLSEAILYAVPYFLGRSLFGSKDGIRALILGVVVAGLLYAPLCLLEMRLSPMLNQWVYGFAQTKSHMTQRMGGYRPMVFLSHGIELGLFMGTTAFAAVWTWRTRIATRLVGVRMWVIALGLVIVAGLCRAITGWIALVSSLGVLKASRLVKTPVFVVLLALLPVAYVVSRMVFRWDVSGVIERVESVNPDRAASFASRVESERITIERIRERPLLGWGGWGRNRVETNSLRGRGYVILDSMWILELGSNGLVGYGVLVLLLATPALFALSRKRWQLWLKNEHAAFAVASVIPLLYLFDGVANYMYAPIYVLCAGAGVSYLKATPRPSTSTGERRA